MLDDTIPAERQLGIEAGIEWYKVAEACIVYTDCGISNGMKYGIARAQAQGLPVEYRSVPGWTPAPRTTKPAARKKGPQP